MGKTGDIETDDSAVEMSEDEDEIVEQVVETAVKVPENDCESSSKETPVEEEPSKDEEDEVIGKLCECYLGLGEISLENEDYPQAVADLTACRDMRKQYLAADSRQTAEAWYQLGVAQTEGGNYQDGEVSLNSAVSVLEIRVANFGVVESSDALALEVADLEALIKEIKEKIADNKVLQEKTVNGDLEGSSTGFSGACDGDKPVNVIATKKIEMPGREEDVKMTSAEVTTGGSA